MKAIFARTPSAAAAAAATRDRAAVALQPQTQPPLVALDRRWVFDAPITLHAEQNPFTGKIKVRDAASQRVLLEIRRVESPHGDLFHVVDAATGEHVLTVDGFGGRGRFDVFPGLHEQRDEREPGLLTVAVTRRDTTLQFQDLELRRPSRATVDGSWRDRAALVAVHHGVAWQHVARIDRPAHSLVTLPYYTLEIAPGVDATLPLVLWLGRWATYELEQRIGARPTTSPWWGQPNPGTTR